MHAARVVLKNRNLLAQFTIKKPKVIKIFFKSNSKEVVTSYILYITRHYLLTREEVFSSTAFEFLKLAFNEQSTNANDTTSSFQWSITGDCILFRIHREKLLFIISRYHVTK